MNETCVVTPSSGNTAMAGRITLTSVGCSGGTGTSDFVEIRRSLANPPNSVNQAAGCQTANVGIPISVVNAPAAQGGALATYTWSFTPASALWSITSGQGTSVIP